MPFAAAIPLLARAAPMLGRLAGGGGGAGGPASAAMNLLSQTPVGQLLGGGQGGQGGQQAGGPKLPGFDIAAQIAKTVTQGIS